MIKLDKVFWCRNFYQLNHIDVISIFTRNLEIIRGFAFDAYARVGSSYPPTMEINLDSLNVDADEYKEENIISKYNTLNSREFILFLILHETMHIYLKHFSRAPNKYSKKLWNYATDCGINEILFKYLDGFSLKKIRYNDKIISEIKDIAITRRYLMTKFGVKISKKDVAENIYDKLMEAVKKHKDDEQDWLKKLNQLIGKEKNVSDTPSILDDDGLPNEQASNDLEKMNDMIDLLRDESELEASADDSAVGDTTNSILQEINAFLNKDKQFLNTIKKMLKQYDYGLSKNDTQLSWASYNKMFMHTAYMPVRFSKEKKINQLYLVIDESGSMGNTLLQKLIGIIYGTIKNNVKLKSMSIIHHDVDINVTNDIKGYEYKRCKSGGTSHKEAFKYLQDTVKPNDMVIFVTDLMSDIEEHWHIMQSIKYKFNKVWLIDKEYYSKPTKQFLDRMNQTVIFR